MPVYRSHHGESNPPPMKPSQRKTTALPLDESQDAFVLPYILSEIFSSTGDDTNTLGLIGLAKDTSDATTNVVSINAVDVAVITSGIATMTSLMPTAALRPVSRPTSPRVQGHRRDTRSASTLSPIAFSSTSSRYLGRTGNNLLGHLLGAVSPAPTHGAPITTVNFG